MLVRWSWPRFRFDQLMSLAWKVMLPLGMVNFVAIAILYEFGHFMTDGLQPSWDWVVAIGGWLTAIAAVAVTVFARPLMVGNRSPREQIGTAIGG
jgi:NADH-quinone oxidoreductase subunit H